MYPQNGRLDGWLGRAILYQVVICAHPYCIVQAEIVITDYMLPTRDTAEHVLYNYMIVHEAEPQLS